MVFQKYAGAGLQFFGEVEISEGGEMTVRVRDMAGTVLFEKGLGG